MNENGLRQRANARESMKRFTYKTVEIEVKGWGLLGAKRAEGFEAALNEQGAGGWRYVDTVPQTVVYGEVKRLKLVFEKEISEHDG